MSESFSCTAGRTLRAKNFAEAILPS
jgi:hypothetical protein